MLILALDTTTRAGSVAILRDGQLLYEHAGDASSTHAERLPTDFMRACDAADVRVEDIELLAVAAGPGSFTGLRIGIASVQGLAMACGRLVVPVSALEAIARAAPDGPPRIAAWMDAQRGEVFAQVFARTDERDVEPVTEAISLPPDDALLAHASALEGAAFHGDGAIRYRTAIMDRLGDRVTVAADLPPLAGAIARIAARHPARAVLPHAVIPIYVRRPDAELARERRGESR